KYTYILYLIIFINCTIKFHNHNVPLPLN
uniref:Uncharacterized protein n=1 Tax=Amphimedon queenslandica TaxID=400682 RepID=A0A1X7V3L4_AMPQE